jgi:hypothetical protein
MQRRRDCALVMRGMGLEALDAVKHQCQSRKTSQKPLPSLASRCRSERIERSGSARLVWGQTRTAPATARRRPRKNGQERGQLPVQAPPVRTRCEHTAVRRRRTTFGKRSHFPLSHAVLSVVVSRSRAGEGFASRRSPRREAEHLSLAASLTRCAALTWWQRGHVESSHAAPLRSRSLSDDRRRDLAAR